MARARNIKPSIFKNELLGVADPYVSLLFISLWTLADKEGRLEDRPLRIKAETFPYRENLDINGYLTELARLGFIVRYVVGDAPLIQIVNFKKHQTPHKTEKASALPPIESGTLSTSQSQDSSVNPPLRFREKTEPLPPDSSNTDSSFPDSSNKDKAPAKPSRFNPVAYLTNLGVSESVAHDFLTLRKAKKAAATETALSGIAREAEKAGIPMQTALETCCKRGWQGFDAAWLDTPGTGGKLRSGRSRTFDEIQRDRDDRHKAQQEREVAGELVDI